jgi:hypothetical protein
VCEAELPELLPGGPDQSNVARAWKVGGEAVVVQAGIEPQSRTVLLQPR